MGLSREAMWERMMASDATFDGRFYTGVHSTGIYCLPSCRARKPKSENVRFYLTAVKAEAAGLRPCKKCRPDEYALGIDSELERLISLVGEVRAEPGRFKSVDDLAYWAAVSQSTLFSALKTQFHISPGALLTSSRIGAAARMLQSERISAADVGMSVGFDSTSAYYENFRRQMGLPPAQYRRLHDAAEFVLDLPLSFQSEPVLRLLARDTASYTERVVGNQFALGAWSGQRPVRVDGEFAGGRLRVKIQRGTNAFEIHSQLVRLLGLAQDPGPFEEHVASIGRGHLVAGHEGLRIPQSLTPFDGLVWSIVGQQVNLGFASTLRRELTRLAGEPADGEIFAPPRPARVAQLSADELVRVQFSRRKAEYLIGIAQTVDRGALDFEALGKLPPARAEQALLSIRGIGPWSANYLMMRALGFPDCVPVGDTGLTSALSRMFGVPRPSPEQTLALMSQFRPFRSLATYHLWRSLSSIPN